MHLSSLTNPFIPGSLGKVKVPEESFRYKVLPSMLFSFFIYLFLSLPALNLELIALEGMNNTLSLSSPRYGCHFFRCSAVVFIKEGLFEISLVLSFQGYTAPVLK